MKLEDNAGLKTGGPPGAGAAERRSGSCISRTQPRTPWARTDHQPCPY
jgi:hypothetical protein